MAVKKTVTNNKTSLKKKVSTKKKVVAKKKSFNSNDLLDKAIKSYKSDNIDWKNKTRDEMYEIESYIDALLYEKRFKHIVPGYGNHSSWDCEIALENLTFQAIKRMSGRRHSCDQYYDDAFDGYDCMSEIVEHSGKEHKRSKNKNR